MKGQVETQSLLKRAAAGVFFACLLMVLLARPVHAQSVKLAWDPNSESDLAGYNVYRSEQNGSFLSLPINAGTLTATSFTDSTVQYNRTYYYVVTAKSSSGQESPNSAPVQAVIGAPPLTNLPPVTNAGPDKTITLHSSSVTLTGTATDDGIPNGALSYQWSVVSGSGVGFANFQALTTQATFLGAGTYVLRLTVTDGMLTSSDTVTVAVNASPSSTNQAPTISAGPDKTLTLPSTATLVATASDDGRPNSVLSYQWSVLSGTGVSFGNPQASTTQVTFANAGAYVVRVTVNDGALSANDDVAIIVNAAPVPPATTNKAPTVLAGPDQTLTLPVSTTVLAPTVGDDGLPNNTLTYQWSVGNGTNVVLSNPRASTTQATFPGAGTYVLSLTVSDGPLSSTDSVTVRVNTAPAPSTQETAAPSATPPAGERATPAPPATNPVVNAGPDQTITETSAATLTAAHNGVPNNAMTYQWSVVTGTGVIFSSPNAATTQASFPANGVYTLKVTASLGQLTSSDEVLVYVTPAGLTVVISRNGEVLQEPNTPVLVRSDDARAERIALLIDGEIRATGSGSSLTYSWDTRLLSGSHEVQALVYDRLGIIASKTIPVSIR